ncbi:PEP-CTERM sorting domain-containing protein [Roseateles sp. LYH14W]|uniref:PEP-CTERM sorting domain-containing protein n=1 Tax=Pelomonas parva TaxID=3299032 RepID=A0ABW7F7S0_9BURK
MRRSVLSVGVLAVAALFSTAAQATSFSFEVDYLGANKAAAAAGSQAPTGVMLDPGDSFTYALLAQPGMAWTVTATDDYFAVFALSADESARRVGNVTVLLSLAGQQVYSFSATDDESSHVHVGANTTPLTVGLTFDRLEFSYALASAAACTWDDEQTECTDTDMISDTTLGGPLPIFGAPDYHYSDGFTYAAAVPEPGSVALMLAGLLPVGLLGLRSRRQRGAPASR